MIFISGQNENYINVLWWRWWCFSYCCISIFLLIPYNVFLPFVINTQLLLHILLRTTLAFYSTFSIAKPNGTWRFSLLGSPCFGLRCYLIDRFTGLYLARTGLTGDTLQQLANGLYAKVNSSGQGAICWKTIKWVELSGQDTYRFLHICSLCDLFILDLSLLFFIYIYT